MRRTLQDLAALAARLGVGGIFFANGWHKLEYGLNATGEQFARMGAPAPDLWAATTMLIELVGGALLVAGLAVPACGLVLFAEALAVFVLVSGDTGLPLTGGDINLIVALGAASVLLAVVGAGRLSVDHLVVIRRREAEAAEEMAADTEADTVIASWREPGSASAPPQDARPSGGAGVQDSASSASSGISRDPGGSGGSAGSGPAARAAGDTAPQGPVTFPHEKPGTTGDSEVTGPRKTRPRRTAKPAGAGGTADDAAGVPADTPSAPTARGDRLVAGGRKTTPPDND
ncbi:hypothetical protein Sme01_37670 [Sphaerisporangium melleum]|uniref:DoxX family protein n=1 Tax=Sphaerisporangium melleum TaxID=321316 RepID=A0A917RCU6_9ACTN|nr:DoxX family protein [Sphaerisporangium melleum]GGK99835.1 hypothetical protein GCM10007964_47410 [Sphaerisporangium melleum]GII71291.1 hypothetical protein Sme01_37670 [Sphaerisporangium melleum]